MADRNKNGNDGQGGKNGGKTWQERKLEKVTRDDFDVISRKTRFKILSPQPPLKFW
jgi:hypothetical protein